MEFVKGHGTENDFVLLPDPSGALDLTDDLVRALCDRRRGLGADGVLRVVRAEPGAGADWFMDYRNADGSVAEMCGNGVRVFARYLVDAGLAAAGTLPVATRAGVRTVSLGADGDVVVDMGPARVGPSSAAVVAGRPLPGVAIDVGNPHLACVIASDVDALDLTTPPAHDPAVFPHGVNVEFLTPPVDGVVRLRVHERGSGETRSCGTGTVAGAVAALLSVERSEGEITVETPGGTLVVTVTRETTTLRGPAVLVAHGRVAIEGSDDLVKALSLVEP